MYNGILASLPTSLLGQLQRVQNAAPDYNHTTISNQLCLNWLPVHLMIEYKLCLMMHYTTVHRCSSYINDVVMTTAASSRRQGLRSSTDTYSYTISPTFTKFGKTSVLRRDLHGNFSAVLPLFPAVKGTECEGYRREGK